VKCFIPFGPESLFFRILLKNPLIKILRKLSLMFQKREQAPKCGSNEEGKKLSEKGAEETVQAESNNVIGS
jgi:hypothetical protein